MSRMLHRRSLGQGAYMVSGRVSANKGLSSAGGACTSPHNKGLSIFSGEGVDQSAVVPRAAEAGA